MMNRYAAGLFAILASCTAQKPPAPGPVAYTVGNPYQLGNEWIYPQEFTSYDLTGLATVIGDGAPAYTADNEAYDANALAAASPVLQLPCIVTVTNLVTGYSVDVRVNDRGPAVAGRILAVTPHVAQLLGFPDGGTVEVEVKLNVQESAALQGGLGAGPKLTAAPVAGITAQALGAPGSTATASTQTLGPGAGDTSSQDVQLSGQVTQGQANPGPLYVRVPGYGSEDDAYREMIRLPNLPARVVPTPGPDRMLWAVIAGPYSSVDDADQALQTALTDGAADPEIIIR
jgi:rare lipoprotein A